MSTVENHTLDNVKQFFRICREDLAFALGEMGRPDLRIQGTITMITELLNDHAYWELFKSRWNVPWDNSNPTWA